MSVFKYHAFIYFMRPPPWYGTHTVHIRDPNRGVKRSTQLAIVKSMVNVVASSDQGQRGDWKKRIPILIVCGKGKKGGERYETKRQAIPKRKICRKVGGRWKRGTRSWSSMRPHTPAALPPQYQKNLGAKRATGGLSTNNVMHNRRMLVMFSSCFLPISCPSAYSVSHNVF